jgi:GTP-binding protein SAR1
MSFLQSVLSALTLTKISSSPPFKILLAGIDNVGKRTLLASLNTSGPIKKSVPTIGLSVEELTYGSVQIIALDLASCRNTQPLEEILYVAPASALIWVVDTADHERRAEAREELHRALLVMPDARTPVVVLCNPIVRENARVNRQKVGLESSEDVEVMLDRPEMRLGQNRAWKVFEVDARTGKGVDEAFVWLEDAMRDHGMEVKLPKVKKGIQRWFKG